MIAEYFPRSDRDQMLIEASPTRYLDLWPINPKSSTKFGVILTVLLRRGRDRFTYSHVNLLTHIWIYRKFKTMRIVTLLLTAVCHVVAPQHLCVYDTGCWHSELQLEQLDSGNQHQLNNIIKFHLYAAWLDIKVLHRAKWLSDRQNTRSERISHKKRSKTKV